jgi:signal transduction histidine kinase
MKNKTVDTETLRIIKHDIKNELSNIHLALEALQYEIQNPTEDHTFFLNTINNSTLKIDELINLMD